MPDTALGDLGNIGHGSLVMVGFDPFPNARHEFAFKAFRRYLFRRVTLVNQKHQHLIGFVVGEAEFSFVCLPHPQIGGGRLLDN